MWFVDIVFLEVDPEDVDERGSDAVDDACDALIPIYCDLLAELLAAVEGRVPVSSSALDLLSDINFVESTRWEIAGRPFAMGVASMDIDTPVLVMARIGLSPLQDASER
ncbi:hypothetical protein [Streptomyces sp. NPDC002133]|uniref:hypothetical protein n=1 Tax=Streptomyces sp. NPDC002133 TaxID=3154409 RepID=UPI0033295247